ncbi:MAG: hypothetical protein WAW02_07150 [Sideroxyarcus sp.]
MAFVDLSYFKKSPDFRKTFVENSSDLQNNRFTYRHDFIEIEVGTMFRIVSLAQLFISLDGEGDKLGRQIAGGLRETVAGRGFPMIFITEFPHLGSHQYRHKLLSHRSL